MVENWVREKRFKIAVGPRGKYVYHRSPSGRKVTRGVPNSVMTKNNAVKHLTMFPVLNRRPPPRALPPVNERTLHCGSLKYLKGLRKIGAGRQGVIFAANRNPLFVFNQLAIKVAPFDKAAEARHEEQPALVEYKIHKAVQKIAHLGGVVQLQDKVTECTDFVPVDEMKAIKNKTTGVDLHRQYVIFMERATDGTLREWLEKNEKTLTDTQVLSVINKVLYTLYSIMQTYPNFRHNDLHIDNILMFRGAPKIADFGWARLEKTGTNPAVNTANKNGYISKMFGIGPDTDARYDMHLFLRDMLHLTARSMPQLVLTRQFLMKYVPPGYRSTSDTFTSEGRLKYRVSYPGLATLRKILKDPLMKIPLSPSPPVKRPSPVKRQRSPVKRPSPVKQQRRSNYTNAEFIAMTPRTFMRLTPSTRARAVAARKGRAGPKGPLFTLANKKREAVPKSVTPAQARARLSPSILRTKRFQNLIHALMPPPPNMNAYFAKSPSRRGAPPVNNYYGRRNVARARAIEVLENRLAKGLPAFSAPSPVKQRPRLVLGIKSPGTGRVKVPSAKGRMVYADGQSLNYLRGLANKAGINTRGLRTKVEIASALLRA